MNTAALFSLCLLVTCRAAEHQRVAKQVAPPSMFGVAPGGFGAPQGFPGGAPIGRQISPGGFGNQPGGFGQQPGGFGNQPGFGPLGKKYSLISFPCWTRNLNTHEGAIIFYREGGPSVCDRQSLIFSGPPLCIRNKILVPPLPTGKNFGPPKVKEHPSHTNNEGGAVNRLKSKCPPWSPLSGPPFDPLKKLWSPHKQTPPLPVKMIAP